MSSFQCTGWLEDLVLVIGYLHGKQYEYNSLTLFQLIAAAATKPIVNAVNCSHDYEEKNHL